MGLFKKAARQPVAQEKVRSKSGPIISAVVPAAGSGTRMAGKDKLFAHTAGKPLLMHTLLSLQCHEAITEIVIVAKESDLEPLAALCDVYGITKASKVIKGGANRAESVLLGLMECHPKAKLVAIHDGARPCVSGALIAEAINTALRTGAAAPALPPVDTLKLLSPDGRTIASTPNRSSIVHIQTPQCFYPQLIKAALTRALQDGFVPTDDCAAMEALGVKVWITPGDPENFKVTVPGDLERAEAILSKRIIPEGGAVR